MTYQKLMEDQAILKARTYNLERESRDAPEFIDITDDVDKLVKSSGVKNGFVVVFSKHTTAAIKISENEPFLLKDLATLLEKFASRNGQYQHNDFSIRTVNMNDGESPNGHSHCQHLLLGASETIPIVNGQMQVGRWQRIFLVELDRPRMREVLVQDLGI